MLVKHPMLAQIVEQITASVPEEYSKAFDHAIMAGMSMIHHPDTHENLIAAIEAEGDTAENIGDGAARLAAMMIAETNGNMPLEAISNAGLVLAMHGLEFAAAGGAVEINEESIDTATEAYGANLLQLLGWTPERMEEELRKHQAASGDTTNLMMEPGEKPITPSKGLISKEMEE